MASYHLCCKVISRGQDRSATAAAAYRAAERIYDRRTGLEHDHERKRAYVDCRSYAARGIDREPTVHEGPAVRAMESRERCAAEGREYEPVTDRARENEQIMEWNALVERPGGII